MGGPGSGRRKSLAPRRANTRVNHDFLIAQKFVEAVRRSKAQGWPNKKYLGRPADFVREVLGEDPQPWQIDWLQAAITHDRIVTRSGQKTGKTKAVIWLALYIYCTFADAQIIVTATQKPQVKGVLWKQLEDTIRHARRTKGFQIEDPAASPETGLKSEDGRIIRGTTTREVEAISGISGGSLWFIIDEASSLPQAKFEGIDGNTIGGGHIVMISNPTRTEGPYFDAFHHPTKKLAWKSFHWNSEEVAQDCARRGVSIPGMATARVIDLWKETYGVDSVFYRMRVLGEFILNEQGKCISLDLIEKAKENYVGVGHNGNLVVAVDCAGPGNEGDKWGFAIRRGEEIRRVYTRIGLSLDAGLVEVRGLLAEYRWGEELPRVVIDSEGPIGGAFFAKCKVVGDNLRLSEPAKAWETFGVRASFPAKRRPLEYERVREELWRNLADWLRDGGSLPPDDPELETELHAPNWEAQLYSPKLKVTDKKHLREALDRSPDKADAVCLAAWNPAPWLDEQEAPEAPRVPSVSDVARKGVRSMGEALASGVDPYALLSGAMGGRRQ
jgi:phage terminase large subunit